MTTIPELLQQKAASDPGGLFGTFNGAPITFAGLEAQAHALAMACACRGLKSGDRVAVMMQNSLEALAVVFGLAKAGLVWVPINARQRGEGLRYILEHARPSLVIADDGLADLVLQSGFSLTADRLLVCGGDDRSTGLPEVLSRPGLFTGPALGPGATMAIMYTSGTTGRPKGIITSHAMVRIAGEGTSLVSAVKPGDVMLVWEPLYHIGGAQLLSLPMTWGVKLAFIDRFSASRFWDQAREVGATHIHYLGGILQILLKQPVSDRDRDHPVRVAWGGGCPTEIWKVFQDRFGVEIRECYGMTEASSITTFNDSGVVGSVGKPVPWCTVALAGEGGAAVPQGERGEIVVRTTAPNAFFPGYLDDPENTAKALRDGALHTGDIGSFDEDGNLFFHGRRTDSVRCRGENVSAWEVEHVAADHPDVEDCAMIGVAAEIGEQEIKLFVKPRNGSEIRPVHLSEWLSARLAPYQLPRYIALVEEFERTPSQRIMKHRLSRSTDCWDRAAPQA
jgi:crotonobetaine/carnitine-CoA ligase